MNTSIFDSSFFGYNNLPDSIEIDEHKLIPIKALKLRYEDHSMVSSCNLFSVSTIRSICSFLGIQLHRPVKGLYCVEETYVRFFDYLNQLRIDKVISDYICRDEISILFESYAIQ
jgi:hypothetical protein